MHLFVNLLDLIGLVLLLVLLLVWGLVAAIRAAWYALPWT